MGSRKYFLTRLAAVAAAASLSTVAFAQTSGSATPSGTSATPPSIQPTPSTSPSSGGGTPTYNSSGTSTTGIPSSGMSASPADLNDPAIVAKRNAERTACEAKAPSEQKACKDAVDAKYGAIPSIEGNANSRPLGSTQPMTPMTPTPSTQSGNTSMPSSPMQPSTK